MEKIISDEATKYLLIFGGGAVALYMLIVRFVVKLKGAFKPYQKTTIMYVVAAMLLFAITALLAYPGFIRNTFNAFILFQVIFLLMGTLHVYYMQQKIKWITESKTFVPELLFTILTCIFGCIGFLLVYRFLNNDGLNYVMAASAIFFIIPFFFYKTFLRATSIPPKIVKEWFYPVQQEVGEPDEAKLKNLLVISFEFKKQVNDGAITNFRAKAPADMDFGQLFYYFINDYNERHPESKVQFINDSGEPNGWVFYKKPRWSTIMTDYIDADKTIFNNHIRENDVIICNRSLI